MLRLATAAAIAFLALAPLPAAAQNLGAIEAAEQALDAAWEATPLSFRKVLFASDAIGFGAYTERQGSAFKQGEQILVYAEPVGYGYKANADGTYVLGAKVDLAIKTRPAKWRCRRPISPRSRSPATPRTANSC